MSGKKINKPVIRSKEDLINDLFIIPKYDESKIQVTFTAPEGCHTVKWSVLGEDGILEKGKIENFPRKVDFEVPMKDFISWDINDPYLIL